MSSALKLRSIIGVTKLSDTGELDNLQAKIANNIAHPTRRPDRIWINIIRRRRDTAFRQFVIVGPIASR